MKIETRSIKTLTPDPQNARKHDQRNLDAIKASLDKFGQRKPIVITPEGVVLAGNGTLEAAKSLGWSEIAVTVTPKDWDYATAKAYALADNRSAELAEWDTSILASQLVELDSEGWDIGELGFDVPEPTEPLVEDEGPLTFDEEAEPVTKLGDVWQLGRHRLMCGDSTSIDEVDKLTEGNNPEMVFTDPPYGINHSGKGIKGAGKANDFGEIIGDGDVVVAVETYTLTSTLYPEARQIWWGANYYANALPNGHGWIVWDKEREGDTFSGAELAFVNAGVRVDVFRHQWHGMIKASEQGQARVHPTQKPVALPVWCFKHYGNPKTVLDLFGGSGSTLIAAEQTNRTAYLMELDPKYCDVIVKRWETLTGKKAELLSE